jgi:hypothetical protein
MHVLEAALIANLMSEVQEPAPQRKEFVSYEPVSRRSILVAAIGVVVAAAAATVMTVVPVASVNRLAAPADLANDSD